MVDRPALAVVDAHVGALLRVARADVRAEADRERIIEIAQVVAREGTFVVASTGGTVAAFDAQSGREAWRGEAGSRFRTASVSSSIHWSGEPPIQRRRRH